MDVLLPCFTPSCLEKGVKAILQESKNGREWWTCDECKVAVVYPERDRARTRQRHPITRQAR